ncbi:glycosyl transferase group 1 [Prosthecochloris aestuarii DSM 271]|uniref:Glycosyl transferase group 1 n=1 Tax=Prosthecochloris aestuarii (strain DSM 271 / SK 413) TaxID=290512 RepID=B4S4G1_PROA2|nr:glycosyltransferase family 4 protein [Prosthecochloris aestuarii]ACF45409.1 glycosyl transferase group 1 [Prosthecochloris aestuarii DSM 271]
MWDAIELDRICHEIGIKSIITRKNLAFRNQSVYYLDRRRVLKHWKKRNHRVAFPYYHGNPEKDAESREMLAIISRHHHEIDRIQVTNSFMEMHILDTGIDPNKVFRIPIGVNLSLFKEASPKEKNENRKKIGIPRSAVVIGSFQKDGDGWEEGMTPKLIKGPDVFLESLKILKARIPELFVLLTGPARGYVKKGLETMGIPYKHAMLDDYTDINFYYSVLDLYIIASRDEGGPKALLESMASGIPVVSTKVGQAIDLVQHNLNGCLCEIEAPEELALYAEKILSDSELKKRIENNGWQTARMHGYSNQHSLWNKFFTGFVSF